MQQQSLPNAASDLVERGDPNLPDSDPDKASSPVQKLQQCWHWLERIHPTLPPTMATAGAVPFFNVLDTTILHERHTITMFMSSPFSLSFFGLAVFFHVIAPVCSTAKQVSWILTTISSAVMSLASLPFVWAYFAGGGNVKNIKVLPHFAVVVVRFFQAYLAADLTLGSIYYRSRISLLGGWIHHSMYVFVIELVVRGSWSHIFCLAGSMEIPTLIFAIATFFPHLRSDILFAVAFFTTRILFHLVLFVSYISEENRMQATGGSFIPAIILAMVFPLHALWFVGAIKSFIRSAAQRPSAVPIISRSSRNHNSSGLAQVTMAYRAPSRLRNLLKLRPLHRRQSFERAFRSFRRKSRSAAEWILLSRTIVSSYIPPRETVLDCVGLRRKHKQFPIIAQEEMQQQ